MLTPEQSKSIDKVLDALVRRYPGDCQLNKCFEECGEFIAAAAKYIIRRDSESAYNVVDELCDVLLCFKGVLIVMKERYPEHEFDAILQSKIDKAFKKHVDPVPDPTEGK